MKIRVSLPQGSTVIGFVDHALNQRDALLIARREVSGTMAPPPEYEASIVDVYAHAPEDWPKGYWHSNP